ncbi:type II secretion system major pseudopilin GspG [Acinetobacter pseudolwoffii]|uniref:type II secretion system major pseudopilin GspG n=1 Tax=Acinetobacter pseudolwoffii TaxID=2053287 RepID=UPI003D9C43E2
MLSSSDNLSRLAYAARVGLISIIFNLCVIVIVKILNFSNFYIVFIIYVVSFLLILPVSLKRLHHINISRGWGIVIFLPIVNLLFMLFLYFKQGTLIVRENKIWEKILGSLTIFMHICITTSILIAPFVPNVMGRGEKAKVDTTVIKLQSIAGSLDQYKLDNGKYPSMQEGGLDALVNQPATAKNWVPGGYVKGGFPKDSWDNELQYVIPGSDGRSFDLYSFGADGQSGGEGTDADIYYQP